MAISFSKLIAAKYSTKLGKGGCFVLLLLLGGCISGDFDKSIAGPEVAAEIRKTSKWNRTMLRIWKWLGHFGLVN